MSDGMAEGRSRLGECEGGRSMIRPLGDLKDPEIRNVVAEIMPAHGYVTSYTALMYEVTARLGSDWVEGDWRARERFSGQLVRALDQLVEDGVLLKIGRNQMMPGGLHSSHNTYWFTPEAWDKFSEKELERELEKKLEKDRELNRPLQVDHFPEELRRQVKALAAMEGLSMREVLIAAVEAYIAPAGSSSGQVGARQRDSGVMDCA